jgi:hypothetical protein
MVGGKRVPVGHQQQILPRTPGTTPFGGRIAEVVVALPGFPTPLDKPNRGFLSSRLNFGATTCCRAVSGPWRSPGPARPWGHR